MLLRPIWHGDLKSCRKLAHSKAVAHWKREYNEAGRSDTRLWRMVDNLLAKTKFSASPHFSPDNYQEFIDSKIAGVQTATATASPLTFTPCTIPDLVTFTTVSVDDVSYVPPRCHLQSSVLLTSIQRDSSGNVPSLLLHSSHAFSI